MIQKGATWISINNGRSWCQPENLDDDYIRDNWDALVNAMDDEIREKVHNLRSWDDTPEDRRRFLTCYLQVSTNDLCIG